jgi:hypothetical protein
MMGFLNSNGAGAPQFLATQGAAELYSVVHLETFNLYEENVDKLCSM